VTAALLCAAVVAGGSESVDCDAIKRSFSAKLSEMLDAGEPVKMAAVREKLAAEKRCRLNTLLPTGKSLGMQAIYKRCRDGVVLVGKIYQCGKCDKWHTSIATGFVVSKDGAIVTNYHVIDKDEKGEAMGIMTRDGRVFAVRDILASSETNDLVVLKVDADNLVPLPVASTFEVGMPVYCLSHPVSHFYTMTDGIVAGDFAREAGRRELAVTCDYAKGASGAPILDASGAVAAIARVTRPVYYTKEHGKPTRLQMVWKFAVPSSALLDLLSGGRSLVDDEEEAL